MDSQMESREECKPYDPILIKKCRENGWREGAKNERQSMQKMYTWWKSYYYVDEMNKHRLVNTEKFAMLTV